MFKSFFRYTVVALVFLLVACTGSDPGPLKGTWKMTGLFPVTITFRPGETETLGIIEKVSYKKTDNDVLVTYKDGLAKGTTMRYTITGADTARTELGSLRRMRQ